MTRPPNVGVFRQYPWEVTCFDCEWSTEFRTKREALRAKAMHRRNRDSECSAFVLCNSCGHAADDHHENSEPYCCTGGGYSDELGGYACECDATLVEVMNNAEGNR